MIKNIDYAVNGFMKLHLVSIFLATLIMSSGVFSEELKPFIPPEEMAKKIIKEGRIKSWVRIAEVDIDRDGDMDKFMTSDKSHSRGNVLWRVYFNEGGEYFYTQDGSFSGRIDMLGAGRLEEMDGNWGIVTYSKGSASTGVVHGVWFEKINEKEVRKHEKKFFRVNVGHKSETREEEKTKIEDIFSRADEDVFEEVKHYTVEEFIEEHGLEVDKDTEKWSRSEGREEDASKKSEPQSREETSEKKNGNNDSDKDSDSDQKEIGITAWIAALGVLALMAIGGWFFYRRYKAGSR